MAVLHRMTPRDVGLVTELALWGVLTREQIKRRHFPDQSPKTMINRLAKLAAGKLVERRVWGFDVQRREYRYGWLATVRGVRRVGLDVPVTRNRDEKLASLPHDATVVEVAEVVLRDLRAAGVSAEWTTERELQRGVAWFPDGYGTWNKRPDGVLTIGGERIAVEVDTFQHSSRRIAEKVTAYLAAIQAGVYQAAAWYCVPGATLTAVDAAIDAQGAGGVMRCDPIPGAARIYR